MFTVFIVDDDAAVLKALSRLLRAKGYEVARIYRRRNFSRITMRLFPAVPYWTSQCPISTVFSCSRH
jgi:CheY-like chemotaxis protein